MEAPIISKKIFFFVILLTFIFCGYYLFRNYYHTKTIVAACNSTNGLILYLRLHNKIDILLHPDTSKTQNTLICLGKNMPFYDKQIEFIFAKSTFLASKQYVELSKFYQIESFISNTNVKQTGSKISTIEIQSRLKLLFDDLELLFIEENINTNIILTKKDYSMFILAQNKLLPSSNMHIINYTTVVFLQKSSNRALINSVANSFKPENFILNNLINVQTIGNSTINIFNIQKTENNIQMII